MPRLANLTEKPLAGAEIIVNGAGDEAGFVPADEFATAAQGALADTAVQPSTSPQLTAINLGHASDTTITRVSAGVIAVEGSNVLLASGIGSVTQGYDADLNAIAGLTPTDNDFLQRKSSAWTNRTPTQATADLIAFVGDSGAGGTKGLVPAPAAGDTAAAKFLKADGTWATPVGGGGSGDVVGPASATDNNPAVFDGATGKLIKEVSYSTFRTSLALGTGDSPQFTGINLGHASDTTITRASAGVIAVEGVNVLLASADVAIPTVITVPNTGLHILDTNASHDLIIAPGSNLTADRTLTLTTGDANRTLTLNSDVNISSFAATFLDDADAAAVRTTLGITSGGGITQLAQHVISGSTSVIAFTSINMTGYDSLLMLFENVVTEVVSNTDTVTITVSTDNGSSWKTGASDYYRNTTAASSINASHPTVCGDSSTFKFMNGVLEFLGFGDSSRATTCINRGSVVGVSTTSITVTDPAVRSTRTAAEAENGIRVIPGSANFASGTVTIFGKVS